MKAIDTNILVYAHRADSVWHEPASACLQALANSTETWAIAWPCIHEFLAIVTHPKIYLPATPLAAAQDQVSAWMESPSLVLLGESPEHWATLKPLLAAGKVIGPKVHDARIAALCLQHGVSQLLTADRDFSRFKKLKTSNPLVL